MVKTEQRVKTVFANHITFGGAHVIFWTGSIDHPMDQC
jgi:hypothetical protein